MLGFSISEYFLAPVALWSRNLVLRGAIVFAPRPTFAHMVEVGGFDRPRTDLPLDLGALGLEIAAGLGLRWVVVGMLPRGTAMPAPQAQPRDSGSGGIEIHPIFATVAGTATLGIVGTF
jgi:hypothetical protein